MPLSEREQRILRQIEEHLQRDHSFSRDLEPPPAGSAKAAIGWSAATVVLLAATVLAMSIHPLVGFVAFVGAVATALVAVTHLRQTAEQGLVGLARAERARRSGPADHPGRGDGPGPIDR